MKKKYISPDSSQVRVCIENLLNIASVTDINEGDLTHEIETGGEAGNGDVSDSRRYNQWDDEVFEDDF